MKAVILAGGLGTRLAEETHAMPKPMVEIGGKPILWHIMKIYAAHGITDFITCLGYKGHMIKEYFANYRLRHSDVTFDMSNNQIITHQARMEPWRVTLVDTGEGSMTGGRVRRIRDYLGEDEDFCLTYGDGVGDIDITALVAFHRRHGRLATVTAVHPPRRLGVLAIEGDQVTAFEEKPSTEAGWINGGFFVLSRQVIDLIEGDQTIWERDPMRRLIQAGALCAFRHEGFWQPMDSLHDQRYLQELWATGQAPWKRW